MNKIYWDRDKISIITDQIESVPHKHWAMQLFLSIEKNLEISVEDNKISCRCIVINRDILHSFSTGSKMYFTMIIELTSSLAIQLLLLLIKWHCHQADCRTYLRSRWGCP